MHVEPIDHFPVTNPILDAPEGARVMLGGVVIDNVGDRWEVDRYPCRDWLQLDGQRYECQGHPDGTPSHRALISSTQVLRWWTYGNNRTAKRILPARLEEA
jgi:hypothetical protein